MTIEQSLSWRHRMAKARRIVDEKEEFKKGDGIEIEGAGLTTVEFVLPTGEIHAYGVKGPLKPGTYRHPHLKA